MATWQDVRNYIYANYTVSSDEDDILTLLFDVGEGRSQLLLIGVVGEGSPLGAVRFFSPFARADQISPLQFANVAEGVIFGLAKVVDLYGVVHNAFLENLDSTEIDVPMAVVSEQADELENRLGLGDSM